MFSCDDNASGRDGIAWRMAEVAVAAVGAFEFVGSRVEWMKHRSRRRMRANALLGGRCRWIFAKAELCNKSVALFLKGACTFHFPPECLQSI